MVVEKENRKNLERTTHAWYVVEIYAYNLVWRLATTRRDASVRQSMVGQGVAALEASSIHPAGRSQFVRDVVPCASSPRYNTQCLSTTGFIQSDIVAWSLTLSSRACYAYLRKLQLFFFFYYTIEEILIDSFRYNKPAYSHKTSRVFPKIFSKPLNRHACLFSTDGQRLVHNSFYPFFIPFLIISHIVHNFTSLLFDYIFGMLLYFLFNFPNFSYSYLYLSRNICMYIHIYTYLLCYLITIPRNEACQLNKKQALNKLTATVNLRACSQSDSERLYPKSYDNQVSIAWCDSNDFVFVFVYFTSHAWNVKFVDLIIRNFEICIKKKRHRIIQFVISSVSWLWSKIVLHSKAWRTMQTDDEPQTILSRRIIFPGMLYIITVKIIYELFITFFNR